MLKKVIVIGIVILLLPLLLKISFYLFLFLLFLFCIPFILPIFLPHRPENPNLGGNWQRRRRHEDLDETVIDVEAKRRP